MNNEKGQILLFTMIALVTVLFTVLFIIGGAQIYYQSSAYSSNSEKVSVLAEAGIDKAIASLNIPGSNYNGELETRFGDGAFSVTVTSLDNSNKLISATGYIPDKQNAKVKKTVKIQASNGTGISFVYGMQIGNGGLVLLNGGSVNGSLYSNGNIVFGNKATVTGDVYVAGGTKSGAEEQSDCLDPNCVDFIFGKNVSGNNQLYAAQSFTPNISEKTNLNKIAIKLKKTGLSPDLIVRIMADNNGEPDKGDILSTGTLPSNNLPEGVEYTFYDVSFSTSPVLEPGKRYWIMLDPGSIDSNNYWFWQNDLAQSYTGGVAKWSQNWNTGNPVWNSVSGDFSFRTYMGGMSTSITGKEGSSVSGDVHANTITGLIIQKDAYYQTISDSTVKGQSFPGSGDPSPVAFPISDANITEWKNQASKFGVSTGDKTITGCSSVLGPGKIEGNITFGNFNCTLEVKSPLWITGNIIASGGVKLKLDPAFLANPGYMVVDGVITLNNNSVISGTGTDGGYFMIVSTFDSTLSGIDAIVAKNTLIADIVYALYGYIDLQNNATFKELNGYKVTFHNQAILNYETGLSNIVFSSGPTGSFSVIKGTYQTN